MWQGAEKEAQDFGLADGILFYFIFGALVKVSAEKTQGSAIPGDKKRAKDFCRRRMISGRRIFFYDGAWIMEAYEDLRWKIHELVEDASTHGPTVAVVRMLKEEENRVAVSGSWN